METSLPTLKHKGYTELKKFLIIAIYLWVVFGLLLLYESLTLGEEHISYLVHGVALRYISCSDTKYRTLTWYEVSQV